MISIFESGTTTEMPTTENQLPHNVMNRTIGLLGVTLGFISIGSLIWSASGQSKMIDQNTESIKEIRGTENTHATKDDIQGLKNDIKDVQNDVKQILRDGKGGPRR